MQPQPRARRRFSPLAAALSASAGDAAKAKAVSLEAELGDMIESSRVGEVKEAIDLFAEFGVL